MKIVMLNSLYPPYKVGGAEKAVFMLAESLVAQGDEVVVISLTDGKQEIIEDWNGIRVYRLPMGNFYFPWLGIQKKGPHVRFFWHLREFWNRKVARRVEELLKLERPDVLHTVNLTGFSVSIWSVAKRLKIPRVHTLEDYYALCSRSMLYKDGKVCTTRCLSCVAFTCNRKPASGLVNAVTACSQYTLDRHLAEGYFNNAYQEMAYNIQPEIALSPLSLESSDALTFGFIGRVTNDKGIEVLLEAFCRLGDRPCRLRIAGTGAPEYMKYLKEKFVHPGIEWLGFVSSESFYGLVDVVIVPSIWEEPMGYVCVESLYEGKSVIASSTGGLREVAVLAPLHRLVVPGSAESLAEAMNEAIDDSARWKQRNLLPPEALERFSVETIRRQFRDIYESVISNADPLKSL